MSKISKELFEIPPLEYVSYVKNLNIGYLQKIQEKLNPVYHLVCQNECCVTLTGSDGKEERHPQSNHEVEFIVQRGTDKVQFSKAVVEAYKNFGDFPSEFSEYNELPVVRIIDDEQEVLSHAYNNRSLVYPDRLLNSKLVFGSEEVYKKARTQILKEFSVRFPEHRRIWERSSDQLSDYKKAFSSGLYRNIPVFSESEAVQFYDEDRNHLCYGFKIPLLRPVQKKLDLLTMKLVRVDEKRFDLNEYCGQLAINLPTNTCERIEFFSERVNMQDKKDAFKQAYAWAQREYHRAQEQYKTDRVPVRVNFNKDEFSENKDSLAQFQRISF